MYVRAVGIPTVAVAAAASPWLTLEVGGLPETNLMEERDSSSSSLTYCWPPRRRLPLGGLPRAGSFVWLPEAASDLRMWGEGQETFHRIVLPGIRRPIEGEGGEYLGTLE